MDLTTFAAEVGHDSPVCVIGLSTRGGGVPEVRWVKAPSGIEWIQADEMTACCGAGTAVDELSDALRAVGQRTVLPDGGTVGGALATGHSGIRRLGDGPLRDVLLQANYVAATGEVVKAGGPTVKNVSGFDVCRLLVGSLGTLGFLGEVIVRTRPLAQHSEWFAAEANDPGPVFAALYRPVSVLWDGSTVWALLEGHPDDVAEQASAAGLFGTTGPPPMPGGARRLIAPSAIASLPESARGAAFVAEVGIGVVHLAESAALPAATPPMSSAQVQNRIKAQFDPTGRLNPGVVVG